MLIFGQHTKFDSNWPINWSSVNIFERYQIKVTEGGGLHKDFLEIYFLVVSDRGVNSDSYQKLFAK